MRSSARYTPTNGQPPWGSRRAQPRHGGRIPTTTYMWGRVAAVVSCCGCWRGHVAQRMTGRTHASTQSRCTTCAQHPPPQGQARTTSSSARAVRPRINDSRVTATANRVRHLIQADSIIPDLKPSAFPFIHLRCKNNQEHVRVSAASQYF
jgi:hypothetical protein